MYQLFEVHLFHLRVTLGESSIVSCSSALASGIPGSSLHFLSSFVGYLHLGGELMHIDGSRYSSGCSAFIVREV